MNTFLYKSFNIKVGREQIKKYNQILKEMNKKAMKSGSINNSKLVVSIDGRVVEDNRPICEGCGRVLPQPVLEDRGGGYSELVTYCPCGATFIG